MERDADAPPAAPARLREAPTWLLNQTSLQAQRLLAEGFGSAGARGYHYRLLAALDESGAASQATLGRRTGIDRSDVVAAVNELEAQGLVARRRDRDDRRRNAVTITPAGVERLGRLDAVVAGIQDRLLAPLTTAERAELVRLLRRLLDHHGARAVAAPGQPGQPGAPRAAAPGRRRRAASSASARRVAATKLRRSRWPMRSQ
jgi:DNA-binding MarR family transcriptional regulator